jgi:uncharacterized repeat protein (TIGR02543 family)
MPALNWGAGTYNATVTAGGDNGKRFGISLSVSADKPVYGISLSRVGTVPLGPIPFDYDAAEIANAAVAVTITNTGSAQAGGLTVAIGGDSPNLFSLSPESARTGIQTGESFSVAPKAGLAAGTYNAAVTVSGDNGISESFRVSVTVKEACSVSFDARGGVPRPAARKVSAGDRIAPPEEPKKDGFTFAGWFASGNDEPFDFDNGVITGDTALRAEWTHKVTFDTMGGMPQEISILVQDGGLAVPPDIEQFDKTEHGFVGWYADSGCTVEFDFTKKIKADTRVYAKWSIDLYTVQFIPNGGILAAGTVPLELYNNSLVPKPGNPVKGGYEFVGWYTDEACLNPWNFDTDRVTSDTDQAPDTVTINITLYAKWLLPSFSAVIADMAADVGSAAKTYYLASGSETYTSAITPLTTETSPADVTIDGGGRVVTGSANRITIGSGVTLTLKNITFKTLPFTVEADGKLVLDTGAVVTENVGAGVTVNGGMLEMKAGAYITLNGGSDVFLGSGVKLEGTGSTFTMSGGKISENTADDCGGVSLLGTSNEFTMSGGEISDNIATNGDCGGVLLWGSNNKFYMDGGKISGNTARYAGGVMMFGANCEFTMNGGTISDNNADYDGGGVGIWGTNNKFTITTTGGTISDNSAGNSGGGVYLEGTGVFTMNGGEISNNSAENGGGVGVDGGTFTMNAGSSISDNTSSHGAGVSILSGGTFTLNGGDVNNNIANYYGGGVFIWSSTFTMSGGSIYDNRSNSYGGGVFIMGEDTTFTMSDDGEIYGNDASWDGGGVYTGDGQNIVFNMEDGKIRNNTSVWGGSGVHIKDSVNTCFTMTGGEIHTNTTTDDSFGETGGVVGTLTGNPQIGGLTAPIDDRGWIHGNTPRDIYPAP